MNSFFEYLSSLSGTLFTLVTFTVVLLLLQKFLSRSGAHQERWTLIRQLTLFVVSIVGGIMVIISLPMDTETKGQILGLIGIVLSAGVALSSTTLLGNALAALMMRFVNPFKVGDFIRVEGCFGRVISRGVFHTEVQSEDRELRIIPNLTLATKPLDVIRSSDILVSSTVSLGYDVSQSKIKRSLIKAATEAGLVDPFVFITELGDFSVVYKVHGILKDPTKYLGTRSSLKSAMIDALHADGIEIVSPSFMNQRQVNDTVFIPRRTAIQSKDEDGGDNIIFDRAVVATSVEKDQATLEVLEKKIKELEASKKDIDKEELERKKADFVKLKDRIERRIEEEKKKLKD